VITYDLFVVWHLLRQMTPHLPRTIQNKETPHRVRYFPRGTDSCCASWVKSSARAWRYKFWSSVLGPGSRRTGSAKQLKSSLWKAEASAVLEIPYDRPICIRPR
jgi:hypothetical protein